MTDTTHVVVTRDCYRRLMYLEEFYDFVCIKHEKIFDDFIKQREA